MVTKKQIENRMIELLKKEDFVYFDKKKLKKVTNGDYIEIEIGFCLPFVCLKKLMLLCQSRDMSFAYDNGKITICFINRDKKEQEQSLFFLDT